MKIVKIKDLLNLLTQHGGSIVSTASLPVDFINQARASNRLYVDNDGLGFVWEPTLLRIPQTDKEVEMFEKWYPLEVELPESLKNTDFLFDKIYGHCPHSERMLDCELCNPLKI